MEKCLRLSQFTFQLIDGVAQLTQMGNKTIKRICLHETHAVITNNMGLVTPISIPKHRQHQWRYLPKILGGAKYFDFKRAIIFGVGHHLLKHKTTRYARNIVGEWPLYPCGYAYGQHQKHSRHAHNLGQM